MFSSPVWVVSVLVTVCLNAIAQLLLKLGTNQGSLNLYFVGGLASYGLSTLIYTALLSRSNLSIAYPVVIGLTILATTIIGTSVLHEKVSTTQWIGVGLMISGISTITLGQLPSSVN